MVILREMESVAPESFNSENVTNIQKLEFPGEETYGKAEEYLLLFTNVKSLRVLPCDAILKMTQLTSLSFHAKYEVPITPNYYASLSNLRNLSIYLGGQTLQPKAFENLTRLRNLHASHARLTEPLDLPKLTSLEFSGDGNTNALSLLTSLKNLHGTFQDSDQGYFLTCLTNLTSLNLETNQMWKLWNSCQLRNLTKLKRLSLTKFNVFWEDFQKLTSLESLQISCCEGSELNTKKFEFLSNLNKVNFWNNSLL